MLCVIVNFSIYLQLIHQRRCFIQRLSYTLLDSEWRVLYNIQTLLFLQTLQRAIKGYQDAYSFECWVLRFSQRVLWGFQTFGVSRCIVSEWFQRFQILVGPLEPWEWRQCNSLNRQEPLAQQCLTSQRALILRLTANSVSTELTLRCTV
jgi:hypothetical protein